MQVVNLGFITALCWTGAWVMGRAAARGDLPPSVRRGLAWVTTVPALAGVGAVVMLVKDLLNARSSGGVLALEDVFYLAVYPISAIGLMFLPRGAGPTTGRWRMVVDMAAFFVGVGVPFALFALWPTNQPPGGGNLPMTLIWSLMSFCGMISINACLLSRLPLPSRAALWTLLAGLGVLWLDDLVFDLVSVARVVVDSPINWTNIVNAVGLSLFLVAAWRFRTDPMPVRPTVRPAAFSPVPMITIVVIATWSGIMVVRGWTNPSLSARVLVSLVILLVVLLVREVFVLRESMRWVAIEAERESWERFEAMVRDSSDVMMLLDPTRCIRFASPATFAVLGYSAEQLMGVQILSLTHPEDRAAAAEFLSQATPNSDPGARRMLQWRLRKSTGVYRDFESTGSHLVTGRSAGGLVLNSRDVTERAKVEEQLRQAQKMEAVGRLAGGVAHDFNNLLAVVLANSELARLSLPKDHPASLDLEEIGRAARRGTTLTTRLLAVGRRQNLRPQVFAPVQFLRNFAASLSPGLGAGIRLNVQVPDDVGCVRADPGDLEQALVNLTNNSREALPAAGGTITLGLRDDTPNGPLEGEFLAAPPVRCAVITIADDGTGMDAAVRSRLFEPFISTKGARRGAGLGLAAVFGIIRSAGGGITVRSAPRQGTTVELWLPVVKSQADGQEKSPAPTGLGTSAPVTILLVEDEPDLRRVAQRMLEVKGFRVLAASGAAEARALLAQPAGADVRLLLSDVIMPGESGPQLAASLLKSRPQLRVLFMSGYVGDELRTEELVRAGGHLLQKPFTADDLAAKVQQVLSAPLGRAGA